jgi:hypothetical protein
MEFSSLIGWCKLDEFILFFPLAQKEKRKKKMVTPTHIAAHLQAHTNLHSTQRLAKELQFYKRFSKFIIHLQK